MALFFDRLWFDSKLKTLGLSRDDMASCGGVTVDALTLIFKDQMEVSACQVQAWAHLLIERPDEVAKRCGISTPISPPLSDAQRIVELEARVATLEAQIHDLLKRPNAKS
jgi:hypothetical protein